MSEDNFIEQVIKYIKLDDLIKEKQKKDKEEINVLKEKKKIYEKNIMVHLDETDNTFINIGSRGKLVKNVSNVKGTINKEHIKSGIVDGLTESEIVKDNELCNKVVETIMEIIDKKRPVKQREYLKRVNPRAPKKK